MARFFSKIAVSALIVSFACIVARPAAAQDDNKDIIRPLTAQGSAAFMFNFAGLGFFRVSAPGMGSVTLQRAMLVTTEGTTVSVVDSIVHPTGMAFKYFISDDMALRVALAFATMSSGADSNSTTPTTAGKLTSTVFGIGAGIEKHFRPLYSTSPYVGAQVGFISGSSDNTYQAVPAPNAKDGEFKTSSSDFRIMALAGFDWFFTRGIALGAEGMLGFESQSFSTTSTPPSPASSTTTDSPSTTTIALATEANVHLVVYF